MADKYGDLEELIALAREPSGKTRHVLLKRLTDLFLSDPSAHSDSETSLFGDVMGAIAFKLEERVRQELALNLSNIEGAPPELVRSLAEDVIEVARPLLEDSVALLHKDLVEIAETKGQEHLRAIVKRDELDEELTAVIAKRGEDDVVAKLIKHPGARLSRPTLKHVVTRAKTSKVLQEPLATRGDLPNDLLAELFAVVSDEIRRKIISANSDEVVGDLHAAIAYMKTSIRPAGPSQAELYIDRIAQNGTLSERKILQLLGQGALPEFIAGLARLMLVETEAVRRALSDQTGKGLAILCKAGGLKRATFRHIAGSPRLFHKRGAEELSRIVSLYDRLDDAEAQRVMRFWRERKEEADKLRGGARPGPEPEVKMA